MFNDLDNPLGLNLILNGKLVGLGNHVGWQCGCNIRESNIKGGNRS
jgi:hypothetical protein